MEPVVEVATPRLKQLLEYCQVIGTRLSIDGIIDWVFGRDWLKCRCMHACLSLRHPSHSHTHRATTVKTSGWLGLVVSSSA